MDLHPVCRARTRSARFASLAAVLLGLAVAAQAQDPPTDPGDALVDHANLDLTRPLGLEDALPVDENVIVLETGVQWVDENADNNRWELPFRMVWGVAPDMQLEAGTYVATDPHEIKSQYRPGDVALGLLYLFHHETEDEPALAGKVTANVPSGGDSSGFDFGFKGIATKSFDQLSLHANAGIRFIAGNNDNERNSQWELMLGASHPVDLIEGTPTTLIADVYVDQSRTRKGDQVVGAEVGTRHQLDNRTVLDVGLGRDFDGPPDRDDWRFTVGVSFGLAAK